MRQKKSLNKKALYALLFIIFVLVLFSFVSGFLFSYYFFPQVVKEKQPVVQLLPLTKSEGLTASINLVAVDSKGNGLITPAFVEIKEGKGRTLFYINPFVEPSTQYSVELAKEAAVKFTGVSLKNKDVIYSVEALDDVKLIGGPSAGAALTVATVAAIQGKKVRQDVSLTGTILSDGSIGEIGGIMEKAQAAALKGFKLFLVPKGQRNAVYYKKKTEKKTGLGFIFETINYEPVQVDLNKIFFDQNKMQVIEVNNISEAVNYLLE